MAKYRVADNTQVNHDGTVYDGGKTVELPEDEARPLLVAGIVTKVEQKSKSATKKSK
jgi:hypothetical protein